MSLKNTYKADRISPMPRLKTTKQQIVYISIKKFQLNATPSITTKIKKMMSVSTKLINEDTFCENKNKYLGTFTLLNIDELAINEVIPILIASEKKEKTSCPAKRYRT